MKGFLFILAFVAFTALALRDNSVATFTDFMKGFLRGIAEKEEVEGLKNCIKDGDEIIEKIRLALDDIRTLMLEKLKTGLPRLIEGTKDMIIMLKPCYSSYTQLKRIESEISDADINKLIRRVQSSQGTFFHLAIDGLEALMNKDYVAAGVAVGTMEKLLFINKLEEDSAVMGDFVKGIINGSGERGNPEKLASCIKENAAALEDIRESLDLIKNIKPNDLETGSKLLLKGTMPIFDSLKPCLEGFDVLKKLALQLSNADIQKMVKKMMSSAGTFFHLAIDGLEGFGEKNYVDAGVAVGTMLKLLFLQSRLEVVAFLDFIKGFLEGINESGDINKLMECLNGGEEILEKIIEAFELIMEMDMQSVIKGVMMLVEAVKELVGRFKPCSEGLKQIEKLIKEISDVNIIMIVMKIMANPKVYLDNIIDFIEMFKQGSYEKAGKDLGDILYRLFLSK